MNGAQYIADFLIRKNVRHVFGYQGGAVMRILDAIASTGKIEYIQTYHEQAAAMAADAYARVSGEIGVAISTSGPGATNMITGIAGAQIDSVPCLFITGQDFSHVLDKKDGVRSNGFQDVDIALMVKPVTKYSATVFSAKDIPNELEKAYQIAMDGRKGAVLLDIPIDVQMEECSEQVSPSPVLQPIGDWAKLTSPTRGEVIEMLEAAKRPVILVGGGVRLGNAVEEFEEFASTNKIPVVSTLNGLDVYEKSVGFAGLFGNLPANLTVHNADLLLVFGARLGRQHTGKNIKDYTSAKIVHVDIEKGELNRVFDEDLSIHADIKLFLQQLNNEKLSLQNYDNWWAKIEEWKNENDFMVLPRNVGAFLSMTFDEDAIFTSDVGQNQMWVAQGLRLKQEQRLLNSAGFGAMGYSLPAAIGAKIAAPDRKVICFTGDGGFQMNMQELMLISKYKLNIKIVIFNNNTLGMIRYMQDRFYEGRHIGTDEKDSACVNLKKLAEAYYLSYVDAADEKALKKALASDEACIIELKLDRDTKTVNRNECAEIFNKEKIDA